MKRSVRIAFAVAVGILMLSAVTTGQEKKEKQKIKIVVSDNRGTKVLIDTLFTGNIPDSVKLCNGNIFYVKNGKEEFTLMNDEGSDQHHYSVTIQSDGEKEKEVRKEISVKDELKLSRVIAKDGIVVTIEGNDEEKVKEIAAYVETKMDVEKTSKSADTKGDKNKPGKK